MLFRAFAVCVFIFGLLLGWSSSARAEWSELAKEPEAQYFFDKESVTPVHVSRYAWVLTNLAKAETTPTGEPYASYMIRLRVYCKTDMVARLSISYFDKAMGKGKEVSTEDLQEWRNRETYGDLYLETNVIIPESLSKEQKDLLEKFKSLEDLDNNSEIKNFINKAKKFWDNN
jgi:hypothetical protein